AHNEDLSRAQEIDIDPASETSVALLRCLLDQRDLNPRLRVRDTGQGPAFRLLIGDQAIRFRAEQGERYHYWDLAETWTKMTSLPFAFAFWLIRPEIENAKEIADKLRALRDHNVASIDELALSQSEVSPTFCRKYYRKHLFFNFGEREKAGLREFHRRCLLNKIDVAPDLRLNLVLKARFALAFPVGIMPAGVASFIQRDGHIGANWNSPPAHSIPLRSTDLSIRCNGRRAIGAGTRKRRKIFASAPKGGRFITHLKKLR